MHFPAFAQIHQIGCKKYINSLYINPGGIHEDKPCPGKSIARTGTFFIRGAMLSNDAALSCQPCIAKIGCLSCDPHNLPKIKLLFVMRVIAYRKIVRTGHLAPRYWNFYFLNFMLYGFTIQHFHQLCTRTCFQIMNYKSCKHHIKIYTYIYIYIYYIMYPSSINKFCDNVQFHKCKSNITFVI